MAQHRVPVDVQNAIQNGRDAGWNVSIRNEKVVITAPDGLNLTIGMSPNQESLKKFVREATKYNLIGSGPARTPADQQKILEEAEKAGQEQAMQQNKQRKAYEAEQDRKRKEIESAAAKAQAATVQGLETTKPSIEGFPVFDPSLLGTMEYSKFVLPNGQHYCIECYQEGIEFTAKKPQGLATHRGFRHQMYQGEGVVAASANNQETSRVKLPGDVQDAFELLRSIVAEHIDSGDDSERVAELEARLAEVTQQAELDLKKADANYEELKKATDDLLKAEKAKVHKLTGELTGKDGVHETETKALTRNFQSLLVQIREALNGLSPAQAVGKIDELLSQYL